MATVVPFLLATKSESYVGATCAHMQWSHGFHFLVWDCPDGRVEVQREDSGGRADWVAAEPGGAHDFITVQAAVDWITNVGRL